VAGCVGLAVPCVRPIWWETQPGYVQNDHQAHTQTGMLKPRWSSGGYNKYEGKEEDHHLLSCFPYL
jgi:hypothetical protein